MGQIFWGVLLAFAIAAILLIPRIGILARWKQRSIARRRELLEDALKHLHKLSQSGHAGNPESMRGVLGLSEKKLVDLIAHMESTEVIRSTGKEIHLTGKGEQWALRIIRAHRLWERYLADEAQVPLDQLHRPAERAEHELTAERIDALEAHLGHPQYDPHGDPIPQADGSLTHIDDVPLTDWNIGDKAEVVHVIDKPEIVIKQILALGIKPGSRLRVLEQNSDSIVISDGENEHRLAPVIAANIHVKSAPDTSEIPSGLIRLADLEQGHEAVVVTIDPSFRGFSRRRLLDLGLTANAQVRTELSTAFGDPRAYRVRGTVVALRNNQARLVWVRPLQSSKAEVEIGETAA